MWLQNAVSATVLLSLVSSSRSFSGTPGRPISHGFVRKHAIFRKYYGCQHNGSILHLADDEQIQDSELQLESAATLSVSPQGAGDGRPKWAPDWAPEWTVNMKPSLQLLTTLFFYLLHMFILSKHCIPFPVQLIPNNHGLFQSIGLDSLAGTIANTTRLLGSPRFDRESASRTRIRRCTAYNSERATARAAISCRQSQLIPHLKNGWLCASHVTTNYPSRTYFLARRKLSSIYMVYRCR